MSSNNNNNSINNNRIDLDSLSLEQLSSYIRTRAKRRISCRPSVRDTRNSVPYPLALMTPRRHCRALHLIIIIRRIRITASWYNTTDGIIVCPQKDLK
jgi:hypothetical protein